MEMLKHLLSSMNNIYLVTPYCADCVKNDKYCFHIMKKLENQSNNNNHSLRYKIMSSIVLHYKEN